MKKTALHQQHLDLGAKMMPFFGWDMPLHYGSQLEEHHACRNDAAVFDVSHMAAVDLLGAGGRQFLRYLLANDVDKLPHAGRALYSCMLNHHGGIVDDLIVYNRASDSYRLVLNAGRVDEDLAWISKQVEGFSVGVQSHTDLSILAIQGPNAIAKALSVFSPAIVDAVSTLAHFESVEVGNWFVARTGYTGEDGLEVILPNAEACECWEALVGAGIQPCGLGARDTLRLEAGLLLYGQDMDDTTSPLESGLGWTVTWEPSDRDFIGRTALELQKEQGLTRKWVGLILDDKQIMRPGNTVWTNEDEQGIITSGSYSPTLERSIAFARVPKKMGERCEVEIRNKRMAATVVKPRFVKFGKSLVTTRS